LAKDGSWVQGQPAWNWDPTAGLADNTSASFYNESMASSGEEFYRIQKLPPYVFAVVNEMKARLRAAQLDVIDLGMGNPDGATPRPVVHKLIEAARDRRNHRYSVSRGIPNLRLEIAKRYKTKYNVDLDADTEAIVTIGAKDALAHLLFAVIGPGDTVVSPNPAYPIHQYGVVMAEGHACMLPMPDPGTFLNRLEDLYRTAARKPSLILISFPHNPTTHCVDRDFFRQVIRLAAHHGSMVVHDFAYADICFDGYQAPSILQVEGAKEVAVEIFSLSKSYNMAGWRVGFCLGNSKMIGALARIKSYLDYGIFQPIQIASIIALRDCEEAPGKICALYQKRRDVLLEGLRRGGWVVEPPRGSMFVWAPIPERYRQMGSLEFSKLLLEKALVAVSPGIGFGPLGEGHVRFALVENEQRTRQAVRGMRQFFRQDRRA
jgi:alanine-synthesizing transaminase